MPVVAGAGSGVGSSFVPQGVGCGSLDDDAGRASWGAAPGSEEAGDSLGVFPEVDAAGGRCVIATSRGTVRSLPQYRHLIASSWISSAQYGHFFTRSSRFRRPLWAASTAQLTVPERPA